MLKVKTPFAAVLGCIALSIVRGFYPQLPALWFVLPVASFFLSIRYGNGLLTNLVTATIITVYVAYIQNDTYEAIPIAIIAFGIALTMDYLKSELNEATEARVRQQIQVERLTAEQQALEEIATLPDVSRRQVKFLEMCREDIYNFVVNNPQIDTTSLEGTLSRMADIIITVAGWRELGRKYEQVRQRYADE